ncbi:thiamin pyrophosphokinase 1-like isoform X3 [Penaeus japonicus]|uniref:thiamin pyrophosphokinase 1-like isoform X3 n=1 Tax=Penaeus japonicus TaxID=27405 RepID=UPI001C7152C5|nr:thiamin pyrophosphokinase 1-like isoform X3 [Penaeus japonicus]XP_042880838.1 thiamin pyrophosphokinase 1-like isoform X3 [Penaeus japonicus]XP_042880839.1 thiamin pyrophosphokinase 1-like isoform X3 [Penaeus japonicus]XP_042880840.1 thiamin pyrophosphokinase 1-like isoform X3 [Penaeus japonicus]
MNGSEDRVLWKAENYYRPHSELRFAVVVLNESVDASDFQFVYQLWQKAHVRMCVDGGTNLYHSLIRNGPQVTKTSASDPPLPDLITGDFDSIEPELLKLYQDEGVTVIHTPNQDETDFTKGIKELGKYLLERNLMIEQVLVIAGVHSERFDHIMANLATLFKVNTLIPMPVILLCKGSLIWLLSPGNHRILVEKDVILNSKRSWCGLIPLGHPAVVTTSGLKWNLDNQELSFGSLVSTSNTYDLKCTSVDIHTSHPLIWTMGIETNPEIMSPPFSEETCVNGESELCSDRNHICQSVESESR